MRVLISVPAPCEQLWITPFMSRYCDAQRRGSVRQRRAAESAWCSTRQSRRVRGTEAASAQAKSRAGLEPSFADAALLLRASAASVVPHRARARAPHVAQPMQRRVHSAASQGAAGVRTRLSICGAPRSFTG